MTTITKLKKTLRSLASPKKAKSLKSFFKTGPGEYSESDKFLGVKVPEIRNAIKNYKTIPIIKLSHLLESPWHEERMAGLLILVEQFQQEILPKKQIYQFYYKHLDAVNNWDLVDLTAPKIMGAYLLDKDKKILYHLAKKRNLWHRRISIVSTWHFIQQNHFADTLDIAKLLLNDPEDLIHKAIGWMLREIAKRHQLTVEKFLRTNYKQLPRTSLRYAIERFPETKRQTYLSGLLR